MEVVFLSALGVGMSTILGSLLGFILRKPSQKFNDIILALSAGVMFSASILGLILPSLEHGGRLGIIPTVLGIFCGAFCLELCGKAVPLLHSITGIKELSLNESNDQINKVLLFVIAIGVHNLPEGIATGVSFGTGNISDAIMVAVSIALQNIPEGMVIIAPMLSCGISKGRALCIALLTGASEVIGTLIGYFTVSISSSILPFALAFAGGTMIYVIIDDMIPEAHENGNGRASSYSFLLGFCLMLIFDFLMG